MTAEQFVNFLRTEEILRIISRFEDLFAGKEVLEIGSGSGAQLLVLQQRCARAVGIEVALRANALADMSLYDGAHIPFPDGSFDLVFSSHVIEHIRHEAAIHAEMRRVLRPEGFCVHVVPSASWRIISSALHYPGLGQVVFAKLSRKRGGGGSRNCDSIPSVPSLHRWRLRLANAFLPHRHGEFGNWLTEPFLFRKNAWQRRFEVQGWKVVCAETFGVVRSGHQLLRDRLGFNTRRKLTRLVGSQSFLFVLKPHSDTFS